jgi:hypothetical protein
MYLTKYFNHLRDKKNAVKAQLVTEMLDLHYKKKQPFSKKSLSILKKSINIVLRELETIKKRDGQSEYLIPFTIELSELVLKPIARPWTSSKTWHQRFDATLCYAYGFEPKDENNLIKLLNDPSVLIAINAAEIIIKFNHPRLINEMISIFSKGRRLQQSLTIESISKKNSNISPIIFERLQNEQDLYTKVFCYRLLSKFTQPTITPCIKADLTYDSVDLKIAILAYLRNCEDSRKDELIYSLAHDPHWEVGAAVAKALGMFQTQTSLELLTEMLRSADWWVRHNAAISLYQLGKQGIKILKEQSVDEDKFAYETAQAVLLEKGEL